MDGKQLIFGRVVREATRFDAGKTDRIAHLLNSERGERKVLSERFPKTIRLLESLALVEMKVGRFEETDGMSDSLRMEARARLSPLFEELGRSLDIESKQSFKKDRRHKWAEEACKLGALVCVGFPVSSFLAFSVLSINPTNKEFIGLGLLAAVGAPVVYALGRLEKRKGQLSSARKEFEGTLRMLVRDVRDFFENAREHAEE